MYHINIFDEIFDEIPPLYTCQLVEWGRDEPTKNRMINEKKSIWEKIVILNTCIIITKYLFIDLFVNIKRCCIQQSKHYEFYVYLIDREKECELCSTK